METNSLSRRSNNDPSLSAVVQTASFKIIDYPPNIRLYEVQIWSGKTNTKNREPILSKRMRKLAMQGLVNEHFASFKGRISIRMSAGRHHEEGEYRYIPIDHIVVLKGHGNDRGSDLDQIEQAFKSHAYMKIADVFRSSRTEEGNLAHEPLYYNRCKAKDLDPSKPEDRYLQNLQFLLQDHVPHEQTAAFVRHKIIGECKNKLADHELKNMTVDQGRSIPLYYVMHPKLDPTQDLQLRCEVAVSPGLVDGTILSDFVRSMFGEVLLGSTWERDIGTLRSMLVGLDVTRTYKPKARNVTRTHDPLQGIVHPSPELTKASLHTAHIAGQHGLRRRVWDIRDPTKIRWFQVNGKGASISVETYFKEHLGQKLLYPGYPYAQIGPKAWVPIEKLQTFGLQTLPCPRQMTERITSLIRNNSCFKSLKEHQEMVVPVFDRLSKIEPWNHSIGNSPSFTPNLTLAPKRFHGETKSVAREQLPVGASNTKIKAGFLYVASKFPATDHHQFITLLSGRFFSNKQIGGADPIVRIDSGFSEHIVTMSDTKPLTVTDWRAETSLKGLELFKDNPPNSVIAVVDQTGRGSQEYLDICADLHKFGDRKLGAVTICVSKRTIDAQLKRHEGNAEYFPHLLLQRLRAMHGEANFHTDADQYFPARPGDEKAHLLVLGGYVSHPPADSAKHCPSVAALVANLDDTMVNWPGEARLQPTWKVSKTVDGASRQHIEAEMLNLEEMVTGRLEAWTSEKPRIVFYRHGLDGRPKEDIKVIAQAERETIRDAMEKRYPGAPIDVTYILVHRNTASPLGSVEDSGKEPGSFIVESSSRYKYGIRPIPSPDKDALICSEMEYLTRNLNEKYQLCSDGRIGIALPIHYAKKLALRTFDYFRFAKTNRFDTVSHVKRNLYLPERQAADFDQGMCDMMNSYLLGIQSPAVEVQTTAVIDQEPPTRRKNPWHPDLDKKMFYL